jgi:hypothetical protein
MYAVEIASGGMIYTPSFMKIGSGIQKISVGIHTDIQTKQTEHIYVFNIRVIRFKIGDDKNAKE